MLQFKSPAAKGLSHPTGGKEGNSNYDVTSMTEDYYEYL